MLTKSRLHCTPTPNRNMETELEETEKGVLIARQRGTQQASASRMVPPLEGIVRSLTVFEEQGVVSSWMFS